MAPRPPNSSLENGDLRPVDPPLSQSCMSEIAKKSAVMKPSCCQIFLENMQSLIQ